MISNACIRNAKVSQAFQILRHHRQVAIQITLTAQQRLVAYVDGETMFHCDLIDDL